MKTKSLSCGLLGHNISYSKSADIFNAIFELKGIAGTFENFDLAPDEFESRFRQIVKSGVNGLSVTIPYKKSVIGLLHEVNSIAGALDAVNSIAVTESKLSGFNTDVVGFGLPLIPLAAQLKKGKALILGGGGGARAVIYSLHKNFGIAQFTVIGRTEEKLCRLKNALDAILSNSQITTDTFDNLKEYAAQDFSITVNCTPLGGWNYPEKNPLPKWFNWPMTNIYYDLNYNTGNKIVRQAAENDVIAIDGSQMLVGQAVSSFEIWTGDSVRFDDVYERAFNRSNQSAN